MNGEILLLSDELDKAERRLRVIMALCMDDRNSHTRVGIMVRKLMHDWDNGEAIG